MSVTLGPSDIYISRSYRGMTNPRQLRMKVRWRATPVHIKVCRIGYNRPTNRPEDTQATDLHPLAKKIVALLPDHETLTLSQIVTITKGKPSTVKLRLKELVENGYLVPKGQGRGAHYVKV